MRTPNLNIGSRTPTITARINPNVAGRTTANTATIAGRGASVATSTGNIAGRGTITNNNIANTAVGRTTTNVGTTAVGRTTTNIATTAGRTTANVATTTGRATANLATTTARTTANVATTAARTTAVTTTAVTTTRITPNIPVIAPRVTVVRPMLPYVRYSPNLYPACSYAYRESSGECSDKPVSVVDLVLLLKAKEQCMPDCGLKGQACSGLRSVLIFRYADEPREEADKLGIRYVAT